MIYFGRKEPVMSVMFCGALIVGIVNFIILQAIGMYCAVNYIDNPIAFMRYQLKNGTPGIKSIAWISVILLLPTIGIVFLLGRILKGIIDLL